jgi:hypothetical protein
MMLGKHVYRNEIEDTRDSGFASWASMSEADLTAAQKIVA